MPVTVEPEQFTYVDFDAAAIIGVIDELLAKLAMNDRSVHVAVDESTPIVRVRVEAGDPIVLRVDSGAFEDPRKPRQPSHEAIATNAGRALIRVRDRDDGSFADAPSDPDLTLAQMAAWDAYAVGRLGRLGYRVHEPRWRYNFRNRHGFSDAVDVSFDRLWRAEAITWTELSAVSDTAATSVSAATA